MDSGDCVVRRSGLQVGGASSQDKGSVLDAISHLFLCFSWCTVHGVFRGLFHRCGDVALDYFCVLGTVLYSVREHAARVLPFRPGQRSGRGAALHYYVLSGGLSACGCNNGDVETMMREGQKTLQSKTNV
jgi:hypothetical protein